MSYEPLYTPGAWYAKRYQGCTCPRLDNDEGWGRANDEGLVDFMVQPGCPIHDNNSSFEPHATPSHSS